MALNMALFWAVCYYRLGLIPDLGEFNAPFIGLLFVLCGATQTSFTCLQDEKAANQSRLGVSVTPGVTGEQSSAFLHQLAILWAGLPTYQLEDQRTDSLPLLGNGQTGWWESIGQNKAGHHSDSATAPSCGIIGSGHLKWNPERA